MLPVIAVVGRPNVGKSTLFNQFTRSRDALVVDLPGVTRDRQYGEGAYQDRRFIVVDTGGMEGNETGIASKMVEQAWQASQEADVILLVVDARAGQLGADAQLAEQLRTLNKPVLLVVNKTDGVDAAVATSDFYQLGFEEVYQTAASHGRGVQQLLAATLLHCPINEDEQTASREGIHIAIIGRPNVGKSTLVNRILGDDRVVVYDEPGTTRDSIFIPMTRHDEQFVLIDTAGVRKRGKITDTVEKFSVIKTLQAIEAAHVVIVVLNAHDGIGEQDLRLIRFVLDAGRPLVIAINKWDGMEKEQRDAVRDSVARRLHFVEFAKQHFISAKHGTGVGNLFKSVTIADHQAQRHFATNELTRILSLAVQQHAPPTVRGRRVKLRYAHQGGKRPPLIVIHGNQTDEITPAYQRYLNNYFYQALKLTGTPLRIQFKTGENPYAGKVNKLTPRQERRRKRMIKHVKS